MSFIEVSMLGDYPIRGRRLWLFLAAVAVIGLMGVLLMIYIGGDSGN